jgi:hypothetical protein
MSWWLATLQGRCSERSRGIRAMQLQVCTDGLIWTEFAQWTTRQILLLSVPAKIKDCMRQQQLAPEVRSLNPHIYIYIYIYIADADARVGQPALTCREHTGRFLAREQRFPQAQGPTCTVRATKLAWPFLAHGKLLFHSVLIAQT